MSQSAVAVVPRTDSAPCSTRPSAGRLRALDGLRLLAALWVALYHYLGQDHERSPWGQLAATIFPDWDFLAPYGWLGVEVFFIVSGFAICMSCWNRSLGAFFRSRVTRLYPAYWVAVVLTFVVISVTPAVAEAPRWSDVLVNLTMLQEPLQVPLVDPVYWTLWFEMKFYLLFAVVVWMGLTYKRVIVFCLIWTIGGAMSEGVSQPILNMIFMPSYNSYFIIGIGLYLIHRFGNQLLTWLVIGVNVVTAFFYAVRKMEHQAKDVVHQPLESWVVAATLLLAVALVYAIARGRLDWVRGDWITKAGALTYPFYLLHLHVGFAVIYWLYVRAELSAYVVLPATLGVVLLLSWLVHRFVERPLAAWLTGRLASGRGLSLNPTDLLAAPSTAPRVHGRSSRGTAEAAAADPGAADSESGSTVRIPSPNGSRRSGGDSSQRRSRDELTIARK